MGGTRIFESSLFLVKHLPLGPTSERQAKRNGQVCRDVSSASIATSMFFFRPFGYHVAEQKPCNRQWGLIVRQKKRSAFQGLMYFEKNMSKLTKRLLKIHLRGDLKLKNGVLEEFILSSFLTVLWCCSLGAVHFSVYIYICRSISHCWRKSGKKPVENGTIDNYLAYPEKYFCDSKSLWHQTWISWNYLENHPT